MDIEDIKLGEQGEKEAQAYIDKFKSRMKNVCEETLGEVYVNCMPWIDSDSWTNFRNHVISWIQGYKQLEGYNAKYVRESILRHNREQIIADLNQDHLEEIEKLKKWIEEERAFKRNY